jgi:hypothetical protein
VKLVKSTTPKGLNNSNHGCNPWNTAPGKPDATPKGLNNNNHGCNPWVKTIITMGATHINNI